MRHNVLLTLAVSVVLFSVASAPAVAQNAATTGRFVSGPLVWTPTLQLREAGIDSNVFNEPTGSAKDDRVATASSQVNSVLTLGILQASTQGSLDYMYFDRYTQERGFNRRVASHIEFPVTRFSPDVTLTWGKVKERAGNEIDTRAPRTDWGYAFGLQTRVTPRVALTATAGRDQTTYEEGVTFRDVELANQLNRQTTRGDLLARVTLTPFTSLVLDGDISRDEFPLRPDAATDNARASVAFEFAPDAVIRGRVQVGYHSLKPHHAGVAPTTMVPFDGVTSVTDVGYTLLGVTRFTGRFSRDSNYSISTTQPLYVSTAYGLDILQALVGPLDLALHAGRDRLEYPESVLAAARTDRADSFGGGLSIRVAEETVVALLYEADQRRSSAGAQFGYDRRRIYTTVTYGF